DWAGVVASVGCAVHCAAMPFVIAYLPALGLSFLADEAFHKWMAAGCFVIALIAFIPGLRQHRRMTPVMIAGVGLLMISVAAFGFAGECCPACERAQSAGDDPAPGSTSLAGTAAAESTSPVVSAPVVSAGGAASATPVVSADTVVCTDEDCAFCARESGSTSEGDADGSPAGGASSSVSSSSASSWRALSLRLEPIAPWLTPLGGLVLVSAHLLNHRYGRLCGCCGVDNSEEAAE
ncbi:MAG: MerC domain-containing protein, partial [Planctomycetota bacterium]